MQMAFIKVRKGSKTEDVLYFIVLVLDRWSML